MAPVSVEATGVTGEQWSLNQTLKEADPEVYGIVKNEKDRQRKGLEMIASENFTSLAVLECLGSCLHNKYSEGQPGQRYYGGNEFIDEMEVLAQSRALSLYNLKADQWGVNVQPYSGSPANFAVFTALVGPTGRIMGLDLPDGGHLTHGFFTNKAKISATSIFFQSMPYKVDPSTELIDYEALEKTAALFKPQIIIAGVSCYARNLDYARFRKIADQNGCILMADMAHVSGLVATGLVPSPFEHCDIVTTTVHKTLRGPRAGVIFFRRGSQMVNGKPVTLDYENKINMAVFPGLQGGPHNHAIAGIAVAMKHAASPEFKQYQVNVVENAQRLASGLKSIGYKIVTGGTDNHIVHLDLKKSPCNISGAKGELILEMVGISCNKNTVPGDKSALNPSGIRLGTPSLTTRGLMKTDMDTVVNLLDSALTIAVNVQKESGPKLVDFKAKVKESKFADEIAALKAKVEAFAVNFRLPGHEDI